MRISKIRAAAAILATSALVLAGCGSGGSSTNSSESPTSSSDSVPAESGSPEATESSEAPATDDSMASEEPGATEPSGDPIKVVVLGGIGAEGILANNATTSVTAAKASVAAVNAAGGILGRPVEIEVIDDTADPTVAITKLREMLARGDKPLAVMNSGPSPVAEATIPVLTQERIISFNIGPTAASGDPAVSPFNFDLSPSAMDYIGAFIPEIEKRGYRSVGILHDASPYGEMFGGTAADMLAEAGLEVVGNESFDPKSLDMTPQIAALQEKRPDAVVLSAYGAPLGYVLQGFEKLGWDVPIIGNTSVSATGLIANEPPDGVLGTGQVENLTMQVFRSMVYDKNAASVNDAVSLMAKTGPIKSSLILAYNFDAMLLLKAAAESAGGIDDADILADKLIDPSVQEAASTVILSRYNFTSDSHTPHTLPEEFAFIPPGKLINGQFQ